MSMIATAWDRHTHEGQQIQPKDDYEVLRKRLREVERELKETRTRLQIMGELVRIRGKR